MIWSLGKKRDNKVFLMNCSAGMCIISLQITVLLFRYKFYVRLIVKTNRTFFSHVCRGALYTPRPFISLERYNDDETRQWSVGRVLRLWWWLFPINLSFSNWHFWAKREDREKGVQLNNIFARLWIWGPKKGDKYFHGERASPWSNGAKISGLIARFSCCNS